MGPFQDFLIDLREKVLLMYELSAVVWVVYSNFDPIAMMQWKEMANSLVMCPVGEYQ